MRVTATTNTNNVGQSLREAREHVDLTRAQLAELASCSIASLGNIEQGAVPKRSQVLEDALAAIARVNDERRAYEPGAVQESPGQGRRDAA